MTRELGKIAENAKRIIPDQLSGLASRLWRCERGAFAMIFAIAVIPLVIAAGVAVDLSRAFLVKQRLAFALDSAGLAVGAIATDDTADLNAEFSKYFYANYPSSNLGTPQNLSVTYDAGIVSVSGQAVVETAFMKIAGINDVTVSASAQMEVETTGLEVVLVLDNTGSMGSGGKLDALKEAGQELIDTLFGDETAPDTLKMGLVPFSGSVNIGTSMSAYVNDTSAYDWGDSDWGGCVMARSGGDDQTDTYTTSDKWDPFYWPDNNSYNNWDRGTWYNIDDSPPSYIGPNKYCPLEVTPLTNSRTTLEDEIDDMWAAGYTHINFGAVWGWRMLSPDEPFTEGTSYGDADWNKAIIILTDGANTTSNSVYTAYQHRSDGILGSTSSSGTSDELDDRLSTVCTNIKAVGITVYTITFQLSDTDTQAVFEACATDSDKYFNSPSNEDLQTAFRAIGAELKKLHISQ